MDCASQVAAVQLAPEATMVNTVNVHTGQEASNFSVPFAAHQVFFDVLQLHSDPLPLMACLCDCNRPPPVQLLAHDMTLHRRSHRTSQRWWGCRLFQCQSS